MNTNSKKKYETPPVVFLGSAAKGSGICSVGAVVSDPSIIDCTEGPTATRDCTAGTTAYRDCTAGVSATGTTCSAGDHALSCTAGAVHV
jgi:hypothetical protein